MAASDINFYGNVNVPSISEGGHDVINSAELAAELTTQNFLKVNQTITISGDASGSGSTSIALTLANTGVTAGTYKSLTINTKGLVTAGSNPTTLSGYGITDGQPLDTVLTSISGVSKVSTGLLKLTNGSASLDANSYLVSTQNLAITGDVTASSTALSTGTISTTLATVTQSTGSSFVKISLDTKGRVIGNTAVAQSDITGLLGAGSITNTMLANSAVANLSGTNTGDETLSTIKTKLGITTLSGSNTGDQTITLTGDVTGTGTGSFATTLANSGVTAGTYNSVTVNAKGLVTSGSNSPTAVTTVTSNYSIAVNDMVILANAQLTATLPAIASVAVGKTYTIKKISNTGTVIITGASTIDGNTSVTLNQQYQSISVISDGSYWWII